jgi:hypothetical protein
VRQIWALSVHWMCEKYSRPSPDGEADGWDKCRRFLRRSERTLATVVSKNHFEIATQEVCRGTSLEKRTDGIRGRPSRNCCESLRNAAWL